MNFAATKGQQAPTACSASFVRQAVRSLPFQTRFQSGESATGETASINRNLTAGTTVTHNNSMLTMVSKIFVGELNRRVRRKPTKPVTLTGAVRSGMSSCRTNEDDAAKSL